MKNLHNKQQTKQKPTNLDGWKAATIMLGIFIVIECAFILSQNLPTTENVKIGNFEVSQTQLNLMLSQVNYNQPVTICEIETDTCLVIMIKENKVRS